MIYNMKFPQKLSFSISNIYQKSPWKNQNKNSTKTTRELRFLRLYILLQMHASVLNQELISNILWYWDDGGAAGRCNTNWSKVGIDKNLYFSPVDQMRTIQSDMTKYCMTFFPRTHALSGDDQVSVGIAVNRVVLVVEPFQGHDIFFMVVGHLNLTMFSTIHLPFISVSCPIYW